MKFEKFQDNCKFMHYGVVEYRPECFEPTCRKPDRRPPGRSWGICDKAHCPFYGQEIRQGKIYLNGKLAAEIERGRAVWTEE